ncbi:hypothetical protein, partial [Nocardia cyriacigeorgica]|uniref:hypothetical protein n=1 Tax=Nocardia cyriacigeorgica TaxID=135487 RepID=UPI002453A322
MSIALRVADFIRFVRPPGYRWETKKGGASNRGGGGGKGSGGSWAGGGGSACGAGGSSRAGAKAPDAPATDGLDGSPRTMA